MDEWTYSPQVQSPPKPSPAFTEHFLLDLMDNLAADKIDDHRGEKNSSHHERGLVQRRLVQLGSHHERDPVQLGSHSLAHIGSQGAAGRSINSPSAGMGQMHSLALGDDLGSHELGIGAAALDTEFNLDAMDFNVDDLAPTSKAYPPLSFPQNTPGLGPVPAAFQSPILPGQNERLYNKEHLYHTQRRRDKQPHHTPLQLPAMTPSELQVSSARPQFVAPAAFEPLTLPALAAADRRRSLLATFGPEDGATSKRRTPHLTPILPPKARRSPSLRKVPPFDLLPDAASALGTYDHAPAGPLDPPHTTATDPANASDAMLPPKRPASRVRTAEDAPTLMGFTMNRLAELQSTSSPSPSPLLAASKDDTDLRRNLSLGETSPVLYTVDGVRREKPTTKKANHKLAEQGRRNRMNQAVHELSKLIPPAYHGLVLIPSKATTVELAANYIRDLLREIDELNSKLPRT